jgi:hypothetical protein
VPLPHRTRLAEGAPGHLAKAPLRWLKPGGISLHASDAKYYIAAAVLLVASTVIALMLARDTASTDRAKQPQDPRPAVEQPRSTQQPRVATPMLPSALPPAASMPQQEPVPLAAEVDPAERERERRRAAAARRKAAERALDLR